MLTGKKVVITGGCGLLGKSFCIGLLENGAEVIIADLDKDLGEETLTEIRKTFGNHKVKFGQMDITKKESIENFLELFHDSHNPISTLVNNAYPRNKNYGKSFSDVNYEDFCNNLGLNLGGYFLTSQRFINYFKSMKFSGNIISISSIYGVVPPSFEIYENTAMTMPVEYAAIKSGLIHLTKYMAKYLKGSNIRVNCLSPGGIRDNQNFQFMNAYNKKCLSKGMLDPSDIVGTLNFLVSDYSKFINGQNIIVDDGFTL